MDAIKFQFRAPPVYFLHVPKTAGLSLRLLFESAYPPPAILSLHHARILNRTTLAELPRYHCYLCHFGIGLYDLVGRKDLLTITMLRDPVERAASHYYYHQKNIESGRDFLDEATIQRFRLLVRSDPSAWREIPELADVVCDVQVRELGIPYDWRPFFKPAPDTAAADHPPRPELVPVTAPGWRGQVDLDQATAAACRRLEEMAIVGITERFDESIELICAALGVPKPAHRLRANVGPQKANVDVYRYRAKEKPEFLEQIRALTTHDQVLYARGCELFEEQLARLRAAHSRTYSIAPRVRAPIRRTARAAWQGLNTRLPGPEAAPQLHRWKSWIEHRL